MVSETNFWELILALTAICVLALGIVIALRGPGKPLGIKAVRNLASVIFAISSTFALGYLVIFFISGGTQFIAPPMRFEPEVLTAKDGINKWKVINNSDEGIIVHLEYSASPCDERAVDGPRGFSLLPHQETEFEIKINSSGTSWLLATVRPKFKDWEKAKRVPLRIKASSTREVVDINQYPAPPGFYWGPPGQRGSLGEIVQGKIIRCFYFNESKTPMWISPEARLENNVRGDSAYIQGADAISRVESGEGCWFNVVIVPGVPESSSWENFWRSIFGNDLVVDVHESPNESKASGVSQNRWLF